MSETTEIKLPGGATALVEAGADGLRVIMLAPLDDGQPQVPDLHVGINPETESGGWRLTLSDSASRPPEPEYIGRGDWLLAMPGSDAESLEMERRTLLARLAKVNERLGTGA